MGRTVNDRCVTVLVVDDDAAVRSSLKFALEIEGFKVRLYDRAAGVLSDRDLPADGCLVTDLRMPGMDGLQLVESLRQRDVALPAILMVSEQASRSLRTRAGLAGVSEILEKPLSDCVLVKTIEHLCQPTA